MFYDGFNRYLEDTVHDGGQCSRRLDLQFTLYSAFLLSVLRVRAHGRLVIGKVAQDIPILHKALWAKTCDRRANGTEPNGI